MGGFSGVRFTGFLSAMTSIILVFSSAAQASGKCESLIQDLKSMQGAQQELLTSFMRKNETMAEVLDQQADRLEKNLILHQTFKKSDFRSMHVSAEAFRSHQVKEIAIVDHFGKAVSELLEQVNTCLSSSVKIEKIGQR